MRLILDLSVLNKYLVPLSYKMPKLNDLRSVIPDKAWMAKLDIEEAYYHIPVHVNFRKYLAFCWKGNIFQFKTLPFGLSIAPAVFTGIMNPVHSRLRSLGITCIVYLDDWLIWDKTTQGCTTAVRKALKTFSDMGWLINHDKSTLIPSQRLVWLGVEWDTKLMSLRLPLDKAHEMKMKVETCLENEKSSRRQIESLVGSMNFIAQFSNDAAYRKKLFSPILAKWPLVDRDTSCFVSLIHKKFLDWWLDVGNISQWNPIRYPEHTVSFWTDASEIGWGGHSEEGDWKAGFWSKEQKQLHINLLEIMAITEVIKAGLIEGHNSLLVYTDNVTALYAINKNGSSKSRQVTKTIGELRRILKSKNILLRAARIPGGCNVVADGLSRDVALPSEWELDLRDWNLIHKCFPQIEIDLMASPFNCRIKQFVSPFPHPRAVSVNALTIDWNRWETIYIFPPHALLKEVILKLHSFKGTAILVARPPSTDPLTVEIENKAIAMWPLKHPPRQQVRGIWVSDSGPKSWKWTVYVLSKKL